MRFKDLKLGTKQLIGFGFILLIMTGANIFSINKLAALKAGIDEVTNNWLPRALAISDINLNTSYLRINQLQHALATDSAQKQALAQTMISFIDKINENLDTYAALREESQQRELYSEEERQLFTAFDEKWEEYQDISFTIFTLSYDNENQAAVNLLNGEAREVFNEFSNRLQQLVDVSKHDAQAAAQRAAITYESTRNITTILLLGTIGLSMVFVLTLVRLITVPVRRLEKAARTVAHGNLDVQLEIPSKDEIGNLSQSFNQMTISLRETTAKLKRQREVLQETNAELQEKSQTLERQKAEIEQKNRDLEQAMEQLRNTQQQLVMKEKMAALGDLVAGVAHEINNPIGTVNSSTDVSGRCLERIEIVLMQSRTIEDLKNNPQLPKALQMLKDNIKVTLTAGNRIATIVKSLRNFARLDEAEYQRVNIHEGIDSALTLMGTEIQQRIKVVKNYGQLPPIACYPAQLNQAFRNIIKNAAESITGNGTVTINTALTNGLVQVSISDSGKGIPPARLNKLFDFGFSAEGPRVKMGSGLITAYNIVQRHNGEILVESELDKGSTFTIILPIT